MLSIGDTHNIALACPNVKKLTLYFEELDPGPIFNQLEGLSALVALRLLSGPYEMSPKPWRSSCIESITSLTRLTSLYCVAMLLALEDVLPHIQALHSLSSLDLMLAPAPLPANKDIDQQCSALLHLSHLTSLVLGGFDVSNADIAQLAQATQLVSLDLNDVHEIIIATEVPRPLTSGDIELLAAMPKLTYLKVRAMAPDIDCSGLPCSWTRLTLSDRHDALQLKKLPLRGVVKLVVGTMKEPQYLQLDEVDLVDLGESP